MAKDEEKNINSIANVVDEAFGGDIELALFYVTWRKHGQNATKAYKELYPHVTKESAAVLGSKWLSRINKRVLMQAYGLDEDRYYKQLDEGLKADKWNDFTGEREADHKTRKPYHDKLGENLGLEAKGGNTNVQVNVQPILGGETTNVHKDNGNRKDTAAE